MSDKNYSKINAEVEAFKRGLLTEALQQCTEEQQTFFNRIFPNGVTEDKLVSAIDLCRRTIQKNQYRIKNKAIEYGLCKCGNVGEELHPCPYAHDINNDSTECNCCSNCSKECAADI